MSFACSFDPHRAPTGLQALLVEDFRDLAVGVIFHQPVNLRKYLGRKGAAAQAMAAFRNLAIGLLRLAGAKNIAAGLRYCQLRVEQALRLLGL